MSNLNVNRLKALVLGGTDDHIALICNLKRQGYYTILIDYYDNPPAKQVADLHVKESILDKERVLEIARGLDVDLVISSCIDQALVTACYVAHKLNLPAPFGFGTALAVTNKGLMKSRMVECGIPTSKFFLVNDDLNINDCPFDFPVMVKPVDSNGSFGVKKANNMEELRQHMRAAIEISRTDTAIVEEFVEGIEVSVDCFIQSGQAKILMMGQVFKKQVDASTLLIYQTLFPAPISQAAKANIQDIANKISSHFKLDNSPLLIQTLVKGDEVNVIEFSPRIGGGSKYRTIQHFTGFDILDASVQSFLGNQVSVICEPSRFLYSRNHIYADPGFFRDIVNYKELLDQGVIEEIVFFKTKGSEIGPELASRNRVGSFLVKAETRTKVFEKVAKAVEVLDVLDIDGNSIMRKDIFSGPKV